MSAMNTGYRRVQSENLFRFSEENTIFLDMDGEPNDFLAAYMDMEKIMCGDNDDCVNYVDFMDRNHDINHNNINVDTNTNTNTSTNINSSNKLRHSFSVDGFSGFSSNNNNENNNSNINNVISNKNNNIRKNREIAGEAKKAMSPDKLAELWIADPKRAKRILANRQSAARSKERKARYMVELEKKVQALQTEATALSAQLSLFERDTSGLSSENTELRRQLESMEQQAQLRDALNDALQQELDRLKVATGETTTSTDSFIIPSLQNITCNTNPQPTTQHGTTPDATNSKLLPLYPYESNISSLPSFDFVNTAMPNLHSSYNRVEPNMLSIPHQAQPKTDTNLYLPLETYKQTMPQFCPSQHNGSPLGHLPQFPLDSSSENPSTTMTSQDHLSRFQGLDLSGRGSHLISNENIGF